MPISPGTNFGRYQIHSQLGVGGMGEVYLARDTELERTVALKFLPPDVASDRQRMDRFVQEAKAASALNHPNILTIYEIGRADSIRFIATEYIEGMTLRRRMTSQLMRLGEVLEVATQVASALAAAHQAGIVHRDIKPENIMLRRDGYAKVIDFGLAKLMVHSPDAHPDSSTIPLQHTASGAVIGTTCYMSPEQVRGIKVDERTDVWSLGVVLYEMVAGRTPFEGPTKNDVIASILDHEPPPLARYSPDAPTELKRIVAKALAKDREERYQTVRDLLIDLKSLKQELDFEAKLERSEQTVRRHQRAAETDSEQAAETGAVIPARTTSSIEHLSSEVSRHKVLASSAVLILLAGVTFGLYQIFWQQQSSHESESATAQPFEKLEVTRVPYSDRVIRIAISPDGKYIAQVEKDNGYESVVVRRIDRAANEQTDEPGRVTPRDDGAYYGLTFSNDSNSLYYIRYEKGFGTLYHVNFQDGVSKKLVEDIDSGITLSPDGKRFAFLRRYPNEAEDALIIANEEDGGGEQKLVTRKRPDFLSGFNTSFAWSPNGEMIAYGSGNDAAGSYLSLLAVRVQDRKESPITDRIWWSIGRIAWLGDGSGLMMTAAHREARSTRQQIWFISYPGGGPRQITNDLSSYFGVSLTKDAKTLVTVRSDTVSDFWVAPNGDTSRARKITSGKFGGYDLSWTPDGKILFVSKASGNEDVWVMDADGGNQKQLTRHAGDDSSPAASPDGRYIVFVSNRDSTGNYNIWRMDIDGSNPRQLTKGTSDDQPRCSPDGRWVVYSSFNSGKKTLWKVPIEGGDPVQVIDKLSSWPAISPDGRWIACTYSEESQSAPWVTAVIPFEGGQPVKAFEDIQFDLVQWTADNRALTYTLTKGGVSNVWSQPLEGGRPKRLTDFKEFDIYSFDWSRDGKLLACERGADHRIAVMIKSIGQ